MKPALWVLLGLLTVTLLFGGGSRADIVTLPFIRVVAALAGGAGLYWFGRDTLRAFWPLLVLFCVFVMLVAIELVPLPPGIWTALPGRELAAQIDRTAGLGAVWRPISLVPWRTLNVLMALVVPAAALILGAALDKGGASRVAALFVFFALASGLLGFVQALGPTNGPLYFYNITNNDSAVGLFANRNHNAAFMAATLPLLGYFAARRARAAAASKSKQKPGFDVRVAIFGILGFAITLAILATASRAGLLLGALGWLLGFAIYIAAARRRSVEGMPRRSLWIGAAFTAVVAAVMIFAFVVENQAAERLAEVDQSDELRLQVWGPISDIAEQYFPIGSGFGTFVEVYQAGEPDSLVGPRYLNHAHNDWLEVALTGGLPALLLLAAALIVYLRFAIRTLRLSYRDAADTDLARAGAAAMLVLALFSIGDYPLRVPSIAAFFMLNAVFLALGTRAVAPRVDRAGKRG